MSHAQHDARDERHALFADDGLIACLLRHRYTMALLEDGETRYAGKQIGMDIAASLGVRPR
jgi:hypothetical protein